MNSSLINETATYKWYKITYRINLYSIVFIILVGLIGNFLTIFLLKSKPISGLGKKQNGIRLSYRNRPGVQINNSFSSSELYMLGLAISDTIFLASHMFEDVLPNFSVFQIINLANQNDIICKLSLYLRNSARVSSSYLVVFFAYERFIVIKSPLNRLKFHNKRLTRV